MKRFPFIILLMFFFYSCEKEANITLEEMPPTPVVEAQISTMHKDSYIKITMSKGFEQDSYEYEYITNAQIKVQDENGNIIPFYLNNEGFFITDEDALPETEYFLDIQFDNYHITGEEPVLSIPFLRGGAVRENKIDVDIQDPSPETDYYIIEIYTFDNNDYTGGYRFLVNDNERKHGTFIFENIYVNPEDSMEYVIKHIPENYYNYLMVLADIGEAGYGQSPFNTTVMGNPVSNLSTGIGFFGSTAVHRVVYQHTN